MILFAHWYIYVKQGLSQPQLLNYELEAAIEAYITSWKKITNENCSGIPDIIQEE